MCEMCIWLARGGVGGGVVSGLGLGFTNPVGTGGVLDICLCLGCRGLADVHGEWVRLGIGSRRVEWCYVCVSCESGLMV